MEGYTIGGRGKGGIHNVWVWQGRATQYVGVPSEGHTIGGHGNGGTHSRWAWQRELHNFQQSHNKGALSNLFDIPDKFFPSNRKRLEQISQGNSCPYLV